MDYLIIKKEIFLIFRMKELWIKPFFLFIKGALPFLPIFTENYLSGIKRSTNVLFDSDTYSKRPTKNNKTSKLQYKYLSTFTRFFQFASHRRDTNQSEDEGEIRPIVKLN